MDDFTKVYQETSQIVYRYLLKLCSDPNLAEELTEETFYQAYLHIDQFQGRCQITTWLCRIAHNAYIKEAKRSGRATATDGEVLTGIHDRESVRRQDIPFTTLLENREQVILIHKHLHQLSEPYREVFSMHVFGELSFREIASIHGKSESWAKMTFYRAKAELVRRMEVEYEDKL